MKEKEEIEEKSTHHERYEIILLFAIITVFGITFLLTALRSPSIESPVIVYTSSNETSAEGNASQQSESTIRISSSELADLLSSMQYEIPEDNTVQSSNGTVNGPININTATLEQLKKLNGIGEVKAAAIIEYRNIYGGFKSVEDIMNIKGIGKSTYDKIKDQITVG